MGQFVNPGNDIFEKEIRSKIYVDKTGLIKLTNSVVNTSDEFVCNSRPRRFGKSYTADMLTAYYSRGCDSRGLFEGFEISRDPDFEKYLNKFDVIRFDVQWCRSAAVSYGIDLLDFINKSVLGEMRLEYTDVNLADEKSIYAAMARVNNQLGKRFVVIIDEWDRPIRDDSSEPGLADRYIDFLRGMFKGTEPMEYIALAYITGILPIKRQRTQSAMNNFRQFTMISPRAYAPYIGFTDDEVKALCDKYGADYDSIKRWYDGYLLGDYQVYNPMAVADSVHYGPNNDSWINTSSFSSVKKYISLNFEGMRDDLIDMIAGTRVKVDTSTFENYTDIGAFKSKDDVFTYMIHLGYLAYDVRKGEAFIPNEEIRQLLGAELKRSGWNEFDSFINESDELFEATIEGDSDKVASEIERIHDRFASAIWYNNENSLAATISVAYLSTLKYYFKPFREMPAGKGFADIVYLPLSEYLGDVPALVIELKWNLDVSTAMNQIKKREYPESVAEYTGDIILVGITYDKKTKKHECVIEAAEKL